MLIVKIADDDGDMVRSLTYNLEHFCFDEKLSKVTGLEWRVEESAIAN